MSGNLPKFKITGVYLYSLKHKFHTANYEEHIMYDDEDEYETLKLNEENQRYFSVGKIDGPGVEDDLFLVEPEEYEEWLEAVNKFIEEYNKTVDEMENSATYVITDKLENGSYQYTKSMAGQEVETGVTKTSKIPDESKEAWTVAAKQFHEDKNMPLPSSKLRKILDDLKKKLSRGDPAYNTRKEYGLPGILSVLPKINTDPCEFLTELLDAVQRGPAKLTDAVPYNIGVLNHNLTEDMRAAANGTSTLLSAVTIPVIEAASEQVDEMEKIDLEIEEYSHDTDVASAVIYTEQLMEEDEVEIEVSMEKPKHEIPEKILKTGKERMRTYFKSEHIDEETKKRYMSYFNQYFKKEFEANNVPTQMALLSIIESKCKPLTGENSATACGMWQIIRTVGGQYGLLKIKLRDGLTQSYNSKDYDIISTYDKRKDVEASTKVAAKLMRDIRKNRKNIDNWLYVAAAYNWGGGSVNKAISKAGGKGADIWKVYEYFPLETKNYVAMLIALCKDMDENVDELFE